MKITSIKQQAKHKDRYSIFVDDSYAFSVSEALLLEQKLVTGQELTKRQVSDFKQLSADDALYGQALRYIAYRSRSRGEVAVYLERKGASPPLINSILNKLSNIGMLDDEKMARAWIRDRQLLRPSSRRKIIAELRKKHIAEEAIEAALHDEAVTEAASIEAVIERKRRQTKYQDDAKLMEYLARQGFGYGDIKSALDREDE